MAKKDVLEAINSTIIPNNTKGITADSLRNMLTMMVENSGEGSGDGAIKIMVPDTMIGFTFFDQSVEVPDENFVKGTFSQSNWDIMYQAMQLEIDMSEEYKQVYTDMVENLNVKIPKMFEHNAEVYLMLLDKLEKEEGTLLLLDQSLMATESLRMQLKLWGMETGIEDPNIKYSCSIPATYTGISSVLFGMELGTDKIIAFSVLGKSIDLLGGEDTPYVEDAEFLLLPDGSIVCNSGTTQNIDYIYVPMSDGVLTSEQKSHNYNNVHNMISAHNSVTYVKLVDSNGSVQNDGYSDMNAGPKIISVMQNKFTYFEGLEYKQAELKTGGEVTVTVLGTLTASTE